MRRLLFAMLLLPASAVGQEPVIHVGDHVRLVGTRTEHPYWLNHGIIRAATVDSATVEFKYYCRESEQRTVAQSDLAIRTAGGRLTMPFAITGAVNAFFLGKIAAHVVVHNGGGAQGARAARYGAALLIPFSAIKGYERRTPRWVPVSMLRHDTEHLHEMPSDGSLDRSCSRGR